MPSVQTSTCDGWLGQQAVHVYSLLLHATSRVDRTFVKHANNGGNHHDHAHKDAAAVADSDDDGDDDDDNHAHVGH